MLHHNFKTIAPRLERSRHRQKSGTVPALAPMSARAFERKAKPWPEITRDARGTR